MIDTIIIVDIYYCMYSIARSQIIILLCIADIVVYLMTSNVLVLERYTL